MRKLVYSLWWQLVLSCLASLSLFAGKSRLPDLSAYFEANGRTAEYVQLRSLRLKGLMMLPELDAAASITTLKKKPNRFRITIDFEVYRIVYGYDGNPEGKIWYVEENAEGQVASQGYADRVIQDALLAERFMVNPLYSAYGDPTQEPMNVPNLIVKIASESQPGVKCFFDDGSSMEYHFNANMSTMESMTFTAPDYLKSTGAPHYEIYGGFIDVQGIRVPRSIQERSKADASVASEIYWESIEPNVGILDAAFAVPFGESDLVDSK